MQKLKLEAEAIQISMYTDIILSILERHKDLSLCKIMLFSYLIKKNIFRPRGIYTAKNKQDIVYKAISLLSGEYEDYCENVKFILKSIHLLKLNGNVTVIRSMISLLKGREAKSYIYQESPFIQKAIEASKTLADRQFMKEVMNSV